MRRIVDTNILVRLSVIDDAEQSDRALELLSRHVLHVETTVILETEWVLRSAYRLGRSSVSNLLRKLFDHPNLRFIDPTRVGSAIALHEGGMDFADALHILGSGPRDDFVTFDRALAKSAQRLWLDIPVHLL
ncbi:MULTISPECIES: type II toxin-antitoxin system VapC family toxin [unclassified Aureimonas]|uniref:type II toxin-antitoxin system VapC family toxin n=1 Tax=unclassified Aureimonas TaxID=2615206 RepID=UPI0007011F48|nr:MULTISPECIES: type II toxin-antitoxin system VapC family toxin [unclassified Aureimonas]KQT52876.1 hypothetical protein ASG62_13240 [Aureimonas sp. Leaf427]KQT80335.1 hypothetical protein ASG54_07090 [Aureimonas sp. Leaf460]